ncbi:MULTISPECIES: ESX secretion-associated protein EspG [Amycolatopsis]
MRPGTMPVNRPLTITTPTLLNLLQRRGAEPHNTLSPTPTWYDETAQRIVDQQVNAVLTHHGLMGPRGMDREFAAMIESIARPGVEFYGWFEGSFPDDAPQNFAVLAGSGPGGGFVLARHIKEDVVVMRPQRPDQLLPAFLDQIPRVPPGGSSPIVAPKSEVYGGGRRSSGEDVSIMRGGGRTVADPGKEIKRILEAPRVAAGSLYAAARTRAGTRKRCDRALNFIDTAEGRWLMEERPGTGESLIVLTPGTPQAIGERLHNAIRSLG